MNEEKREDKIYFAHPDGGRPITMNKYPDLNTTIPMENDLIQCYAPVRGVLSKEYLPTDFDEDGNGLDYRDQLALNIPKSQIVLDQCERVLVLANVYAEGKAVKKSDERTYTASEVRALVGEIYDRDIFFTEDFDAFIKEKGL